MSIVVAGVSHRTCSVDVLEKLSLALKDHERILRKLRAELSVSGAVLLSTCNRVEIYVHGDKNEATFSTDLAKFLASRSGLSANELSEAVYVHEGRDAARHLFRVAASLDSLVMGENQILGQVRDAYLLSHGQGMTDKILNGLFQRAVAVGKRVRTHTMIGAGGVSVGAAAVELATSIFEGLSKKTALILGAGETASLVLKSLVARGVGHVIVANRSMERAVALAEYYHGEPVVLDDLPRYLARADVIISSTGAEHHILTEALLKEALRERGQSPILIIDIAIPRDVDPQVGRLDNVYLFDMKSLDVLAEANREARREEEERCVSLVETSADQFCAWQEGLVAEPTLMSLSARLHAIREEELARSLNRLAGLDDNARAEIDYLTKRIVNKILQTPMSGVKEEIQHHDPGTVLHLVKRMFGIREG